MMFIGVIKLAEQRACQIQRISRVAAAMQVDPTAAVLQVQEICSRSTGDFESAVSEWMRRQTGELPDVND